MIIIGVIKLLFTLVSVYFVDSVGRKKLLLYGIVIVALGMALLTICSLITNNNIQSPAVFIIGLFFVFLILLLSLLLLFVIIFNVNIIFKLMLIITTL